MWLLKLKLKQDNDYIEISKIADTSETLISFVKGHFIDNKIDITDPILRYDIDRNNNDYIEIIYKYKKIGTIQETDYLGIITKVCKNKCPRCSSGDIMWLEEKWVKDKFVKTGCCGKCRWDFREYYEYKNSITDY